MPRKKTARRQQAAATQSNSSLSPHECAVWRSLAVGCLRTRAWSPFQHRTMQSGACFGEAAEDHVHEGGRGRQAADDRGHRNIRRPFGGESIDAGGDRGKRHRCEAMHLAEFERATIAGGQRFILALASAMPDRAYGVNHMPGREPVASGDFCIAGGTTAKAAAFGEQLPPGSAMDGAVDATSAEQRFIRGVDDGVNAQSGDVGFDDLEPGRADLARFRCQAEAGAAVVTPFSANSCCSSPAWNISRMISQPPTNSPLT